MEKIIICLLFFFIGTFGLILLLLLYNLKKIRFYFIFLNYMLVMLPKCKYQLIESQESSCQHLWWPLSMQRPASFKLKWQLTLNWGVYSEWVTLFHAAQNTRGAKNSRHPSDSAEQKKSMRLIKLCGESLCSGLQLEASCSRELPDYVKAVIVIEKHQFNCSNLSATIFVW